MIAEILLNTEAKELNKTFDYIVPTSLEKDVNVGTRVYVPFANRKTLANGFVINIKEASEFAKKEIQGIAEEKIDESKVELAKLMSRRYFCNLSSCLKLMLPPGRATTNRVNIKKGNFVYLKAEIEDIDFDIQKGIIKSAKQIRALNFLKENNGTYMSDLLEIADITRDTINSLVKKDYVEIVEQQIERNIFINKNVKRDKPLLLTEEQQTAFNKVKQKIDCKKFQEFLLYGVTGSGKTEVYLQLIEEVISKGKKAVVLVPEISLTPQMIDRFLARFGEEISVLHSKLSIGERFDSWKKIQNGESKIVIGARSAIFAPINNLGIIIIDEEHDSSYKSETTPRYNAKDIAKYICKENNIPLILGSATPEVTTFYKTTTGEIELLKLSKRANNSNLPSVEIVDLRDELAKGNKSMISSNLNKLIGENLNNKLQTILFLNRRGYSNFVMCRDCGFTLKCKNCNITLTYHLKENRLKCHYCGYETKNVLECPSCKSKKIKGFGVGTQKLEEEIKKLYPDATTIRMDIDTVSKKNSHEQILNKFKEENIDILIGTQMVVKGHHFPKVTLVGVIAADSTLNIEDYRANEKTFQLLTQVAGRAGRENLPGKVIVQTYNPDNFSIEYAKKQDYDIFYKTEINFRQKLKYPPFCDIIMMSINGSFEENTLRASQDLFNITKKILNKYNEVQIYQPVPAPINKIKNKYRWRIIIKSKLNNKMIDLLNKVMKEYNKLDYKDTSIIIDINPINLM